MTPAIRRAGPALAAGLALAALLAWERHEFSLGASRAVLDAARGLGACALLFGLCGYAPARLALPATLRPHALLLAFPLGAVTSALALSALGFARVPFDVALALVLAAGAAGTVLAWRRARAREDADSRGAAPTGQGEASRAAGGTWSLLGPLAVAAAIVIVVLSPVWRTGFSTVVGQNGDVVLAVGSAELVKRTHPTAIRAELPVDRIPLAWRSKVPIFYVLAAVSSLSGLSVIAAFPLLCAALVAMAAFGFYCLARYALRAPPAAALAAMAAVGLSRIAVHVADHPFYNQLWALFSLPFVLLAAHLVLRERSRAAAGLLVGFGLAGAFAYPLMLPFPALFLAVGAWLARRGGGLRLARPGWGTAVAGVAVLALGAALFRGVAEKSAGAAVALSPWGDLTAWSGDVVLELPYHRFLGLPAPPGGAVAAGLMLAVVLAAAAWGLRRSPREVAIPLGATVAAALLFGVYFRHRAQAELFYFKDMGFAGPLAASLAVVGLWDLAGRLRDRRPGARALGAAAAAALVAFAAGVAIATRREVTNTYAYATTEVLELRDWASALPPGASVRIDVPPSGYQLWTQYMLAARPVSASRPLVGFFPYPPRGRRADFVIAMTTQRRPRDAAGPPVFQNAQFRLWRMRPDVPGPDTSSRRMVDSITEVNIV